MAEGSRRRLTYIAESTWGTTPATPSMAVIRNTGGAGIGVNRAALTSGEFRSDRAIPGMRLGAKKVGLDIPFELSYGSMDDFLAAALFGDWTANVLKQGTTPKFFTIEEGFTDIGQYQVGRGFMIDTLNLSLKPEAIVTGSFGLVGKSASILGATSLDSDPTAANDNEVFDAFTGSINEGGASSAIVTALDLSLKNGLESKAALFQEDAARIGVGRANLTGNASLYFTSADMANKFLNETESSLEFVLTDPAGNSYTWTIPRLKYTGSSKALTENDVIITLPFQALYDDAQATCLKIVRAPHA